MTPVVIDASAGVEIVTDTARGRRLAGLLPNDAEGWVPEHFYVEVAGALRHLAFAKKTITDVTATAALGRLQRWHLRQALVAPLLDPSWRFRHNITIADAVYLALAEELGAALLSDDRRLLGSPTFPPHVPILALHVT